MVSLVKPSTIRAYDRGLAEAFSLQSLWMLWEGSGAPFEQRSRQQATLSTSKPTWVAEEEGAALSFASGSSQYVQLRNALPNLALTGTTVMARFKPKATLVNGMAAGAVEFATNRALGVGSDSSGHVGAIVATSSGTIVQAAGSNVWTNKWVTAAVSSDGSSALVYENGQLASTGFISGSAALTTGYADTVVGCNVETAGTRLPFNGSVLWACVFGRQLTADEIFWLYANDFPACLFKRRALFKPATAGASTISGDLSATFASMTLAAEGTLGPITAQAAVTFSGMTLSAAGVLPIAGQAAVTFGPMTVAGEGALGAISGEAAITFADMSLQASGGDPNAEAAAFDVLLRARRRGVR